MAFYSPMIVGVHVLLVDSDMTQLLRTANLLQENSYRVSVVREISSVATILSQSDSEVDILMVDTNSYDPLGFDFVHNAIDVGMIVILMCTKADANLVKFAIEDGAFLVMEKPISIEEMKYLWQHVLREKTRKSREKSVSGEASLDQNSASYITISDTSQEISLSQDGSIDKVTSQKGSVEYINFGPPSHQNYVGGQSKRSRLCMEWTPELHEKFMAAIKQLGDGRCFPKDILEIMNVPGLTRMQVASHLQKCRYSVQHSRNRKASSSLSKPRRFGLSPCIMEGSQDSHQKDNNIEHLFPTIGAVVLNMGQQAAPSGTTLSLNKIGSSRNNVLGNAAAAEPPQGLQTAEALFSHSSENNVLGNAPAAELPQGLQTVDALFDIPISDDQFDLQQFDYDYSVSDIQACSNAGEQEPGNQTSPWI